MSEHRQIAGGVMEVVRFPANVAAFLPPTRRMSECRLVIAGLMARLKVEYGRRAGVCVLGANVKHLRSLAAVDAADLPALSASTRLSYLFRLVPGKKPRPVWEPFTERGRQRPLLFDDPAEVTRRITVMALDALHRSDFMIFGGVWFDPALGVGRADLPVIMYWPELNPDAPQPFEAEPPTPTVPDEELHPDGGP